MPDESTHNVRMRDFGEMERDVVYLLTDPCRQPTVWTVPDIGREIETSDPEAVVRPLVNAGLLHTIGGGVVIATPAAFHLTSLVGHSV
jgi:hypothetical protein